MALNTEGLREWAKLANKKIQLKADLAKIIERMTEIGPALIDNLASEGIPRLTIEGRTVFPKEIIYAKITNKEDAIRVLRDAGLNDFISEGYNTNSISAYVREIDRNEEELPEAFGDTIKIGKKFDLSSVKA